MNAPYIPVGAVNGHQTCFIEKLIQGFLIGSEKRFIIKDNVIYGLNEGIQLWSYSLGEEVFEIIIKVSSDIDYFTDLKQGDVLMTLRSASKKEVAELTLAN